MPYSILIHHTYSTVIIALAQEKTILAQSMIDSKHIGKRCMLTIDSLLSKQHITLKDIVYIAVNNGPGPFSTLRSVIASVNGLHFATNIPLIAIDGLQALYTEWSEQSEHLVIALSNAYADDVYFYFTHNGHHESGYKNIDALLNMLRATYSGQNITFVGNGSTLYQNKIVSAFGPYVHIQYNHEHASIEFVVQHAYAKWKQKTQGNDYLSAQYIKTYKLYHPSN